jgi:hypothetical protein
MNAFLKIPAVATVCCAMVGQSLASQICARPDEAMALRTAALQQELMVAALYCDDVSAYNRFVISYRRDLQDSDAALLGYFERASQRAGMENYNAYKTALANNFSLASLHDRQGFCYSADTAFGEAPQMGSLASFIAAQPAMDAEAYPACREAGGQDETVAGGSSATRVATAARN